MASSRASPQRGPISCNPTGKPSRVNPQGIEIAGIPGEIGRPRQAQEFGARGGFSLARDCGPRFHQYAGRESAKWAPELRPPFRKPRENPLPLRACLGSAEGNPQRAVCARIRGARGHRLHTPRRARENILAIRDTRSLRRPPHAGRFIDRRSLNAAATPPGFRRLAIRNFFAAASTKRRTSSSSLSKKNCFGQPRRNRRGQVLAELSVIGARRALGIFSCNRLPA